MTSNLVMRFQHPVSPGEDTTGWMKPPEEEGKGGVDATEMESLPTYELDEVQKHDKEVCKLLQFANFSAAVDQLTFAE